jgi:hypothetical protein
LPIVHDALGGTRYDDRVQLLDQATMGRLFAVTDEVPVDREQLSVELVMTGAGSVRRTAAGKIAIVLPEGDGLNAFLAELPAKLQPLLATDAP